MRRPFLEVGKDLPGGFFGGLLGLGVGPGLARIHRCISLGLQLLLGGNLGGKGQRGPHDEWEKQLHRNLQLGLLTEASGLKLEA